MTSCPIDLKDACDRALRLHQAGAVEDAERLYLQILSAAPDNFTACHSLGIIRAQQGRNAEAIALLGAALTADPGIARAWVNYGNVLGAAGRPAEARQAYDKALELQPSFLDALPGKARALLELRQPGEALAVYDEILALRPDDVETLNERGNILRGLKRFQDALTCYDRALAIEPRLAEVLVNRGAVLSELGRHHDALASYDAALAIDPGFAAALNNRGFTLRELGRLEDALAHYDRALAIAPDYPAALNNRAKLLCEMNRIDEGFADFMRTSVIAGARSPETAMEIAPHRKRHDDEQRDYLAGLAGDPAAGGLHPAGGSRLAGPAINPDNDAGAIAQRWRAATPKHLVIDNFLTPDALAGLQRFCRESTVWRTTYEDGYLGAFPEQGFACPLLAQIAEDLRLAFPAVFGGHPLRYLWAFNYDSGLAGTKVHADEAAVNVNFWITPDDANRDPQSGGLVIWDAKPPPDWDFARFNGEAAPIEEFLGTSGAKPITVPYRANRAVIFDSELFHQTDAIRFKPGYRNRRINITLLFGRRAAAP